MDGAALTEQLNNFDVFSGQVSNMYANYKGTDKLNLTADDKKSILA